MKRLPTPDWMSEIVTRIAEDFNLPVPVIEFKQFPFEKFVYGFPKKGPDAGKRIKYLKQYGEGAYHAHAQFPWDANPNGRLVIRIRDPELPILPMIVLHEMAHLVAGEGTNHSPEFYWHLYCLADRYGPGFGIEAGAVARWEAGYKPRNSVEGYELYCKMRSVTAQAAA